MFFSWHWQVFIFSWRENAIIFILWISLHILAYMYALIHFVGAGYQSRREEGIFNAIHQVTEPNCWVTWRNAIQNDKKCLAFFLNSARNLFKSKHLGHVFNRHQSCKQCNRYFYLNHKFDFGFKDFTLWINLLHKILNLSAGFCFLYRVDWLGTVAKSVHLVSGFRLKVWGPLQFSLIRVNIAGNIANLQFNKE